MKVSNLSVADATSKMFLENMQFWTWPDSCRIVVATYGPLTAMEDYAKHCEYMARMAGTDPSAAIWEARIWGILMVIEMVYGLEETYDF